MRALKFLAFLVVLLAGGLLHASPSQATAFACNGSTIANQGEIEVDLDLLTCNEHAFGPAPNANTDIDIVNSGTSGATTTFYIALYNGAGATISGADGGNGTIGSVPDFATLTCGTASGCTISVSGTYNANSFSFNIVVPSGANPTATLSGTDYGPSDTTPPAVQSISLSGTPAANAASVSFSVDFDETANNVSTDDFQVTTVSGTATGTVSSVSAASGDPITVTVNSITGTGSIRLDLKSSTNITDSSGNGNGTNGFVAAFTSGSTHTVDRDAPTVTVDIVDTALNDGDATSVVNFTFSESTSDFTAADLTVVDGTVSGLSGSGTSYTATFIAADGADNIGSVTVNAASYTDGAGNAGAAGTDSVTIDTRNPTVTVNIVDTALNDGDTVSVVTFTFSESTSDFAVGDLTAVNGAISGFSGSGTSYSATFTADDNVDGTGSVTVNAASYTDGVGNTGATGTDSVTIDTRNPTVTVNIVDAALNDGDTTSVVTFTFSESTSDFAVGDLTAVNGAISGFSGSGTSYSATFTADDNVDGTGSVTVNAASYTDGAGNTGATGTDNVTIDTRNPTVAEVTAVSTPTSDATPNYTFSTNEVGILSLSGGCGTSSSKTLSATGNHTITLTQADDSSALSPGTYTCTLVVTDAAGNGSTPLSMSGFQVVTTTAPGFAKAFSPSTISVGSTSTLTFTIDNSSNALAATSLDFTDNLPAGMTVATPANASTTCTGGTVTASGGGNTVSYSGGTVGAGATCTVQADVTSSSPGAASNTSGNLTSSLGNSGTAAATLTVTAPEISVAETGLGQGAIADGGTLGQGSQAAGTAVTLTFTVTNSGTSALTLGTATSSNASNVVVNQIQAPGSTSVTASGGTTTFAVQYTPTLAGAFSFDLSFTNNDGDENPYNFTVSGTGSGAPEISVAETGLGQGSIADGGTLAQGSQAAGTAVTLTFTVTNTGLDALTLATATSSNASNVVVNQIQAPGSTSVTASGGTTTFAVQYTPTLAGAFSFDLSFTNNDGDENPYNFTVSGTGSGVPEISVAETGLGQGSIADGGTLAQGSQAAGTAVTLTFTVTNTGLDALTLATATSSNASNVVVNQIQAPGSTSVTAGGGTTTFAVQYTPTLAGAFSFDLSFTNNDGDENPYNFTVSGTGSGVPEISVAETGLGQGSVADGGTLGQGSQAAGTAVTLTFTVTNTGLDALTLATATSSSDTNVVVNAISAPALTSVTGGGGTTTFTVQYTPTLAGAFSFDLSFANNDSDENPYNFTVSGTGSGAPEISVAETGLGQGAIADGGTLGQGSQAAGTAVTLTFTVTNTGLDALTLATATSSNASNVVVNQIQAPGSTSVTASGGTTTFTVQYTPTLAGAFSFDLSFTNNDGDENPYNFTVSGTGAGTPEISVASSASGAVADGGTDTIPGLPTMGVATSVTYTITNSGVAPLSVTAPTVAGNVSGVSNVTVDSFSLGATSVAANGGTTTLVVNYTPTGAGAFSFDFSFANDDADENPYNITVTGTTIGAPAGLAAQSGGGQAATISSGFGSPLVAIVTDANGNGVPGVSVTFTAPASGASLIFATTGANTQTVVTAADGTATSSAMTANATSSPYVGGAFTPYSVVASATGLTDVSFSLTNTRDSAADIARTQEVIASFIISRADLIVQSQPDIVSHLNGGPFGHSGGANRISVDIGPNSQSANFDLSLSGFAAKAALNEGTEIVFPEGENPFAAFDALDEAAPSPLLGYADDGASLPADGAETVADVPQSGFDAWIQGSFAATQNKQNKAEAGIVFGGAEYRFGDDALIGIMGQFDLSSGSNSNVGSSARGTGWMAGPYVVARLGENLYVDGRATYGQSYNEVNPLGLFSDAFTTDRVLLQAGLTGDFAIGDFTFSPFARVTYYWEGQRAYVDTLNNAIPGQEFDLGRLEFGPKISWNVPMEAYDLALDLSVTGVYDFNKLQNAAPSNTGLAASDATLRAKISAGAEIVLPDSAASIRATGFYDGIGVSDYRSYGGDLSIHVPF